MNLPDAHVAILQAFARMKALYNQPVFNEWVLVKLARESGAILAEQNPRPLRAYATALGLAFQIADDILDVTGDPQKAGKRLQKDAAAGKATFVSLLGLDAARARAKSLVELACDHIAPYGASAQNLIDCARFTIARES